MARRTARQSSSGPSTPSRLDGPDAAIEGDPGHHLGVGEMARTAAHFPEALVGLLPDSVEMAEQRALEGPVLLAQVEAAAARLVQRVHHLAEHVELQLAVRGVADPHRLRRLVAGQPGDLGFGEPPLARQAVHDLQLRRRARGGPQQPVAPGAGLAVVARVHQREQRERRVTQPAEPVVPVARAAELLRQRRRRRRDHAARRREGERLQRDERSHDRVGPLAVGTGARRPLGPEALGVLERRFGIDRPWAAADATSRGSARTARSRRRRPRSRRPS